MAHLRRRPARALMARVVQYETDDAETVPRLRPHPCPGCDYVALVYRPETALTACTIDGCDVVLTEVEYEQRYGQDPPRRTGIHPPVVYYMRLAELVKIGWSTHLARRLDHLNPQGVMAVEWGARALESERHNQFATDHVHGEWFRLTDALVAHVVDTRARFERDTGTSTEAWLAEVGAAPRHARSGAGCLHPRSIGA